MGDKEVETLIDFVKEISCLIYGKEVFFYDENDDMWYSREHNGYIEFKDVITWLKDRIYPLIQED